MHTDRSRSSVSLALLITLASPALIAQVTVDVGASKDNTLYVSATGHLSNGAGTRFFCGNTATGLKRRGLIQFDLQDHVPRCSQITSVELILLLVQSRTAPQDVNLHRVTQDWGEGASRAPSGQGPGGPSMPGDATWIHTFYSDRRWNRPGGDFDPTVSGTTRVSILQSYTWASTAQMVAEVQSWLDDPRANFGWMLRAPEQGTFTANAWATHEDPNPSQRPILRITYLPPLASVTSTGTGCSGSGGSPLTLQANGNPTVPAPGFQLGMTGGPPGTINGITFALGLATSPIPLGNGCFAYVDPALVISATPGDANRNVPLPVPNDQSLLGARLSVQGAVVDSTTSMVTSSNALTLKLGL